MELYLPPVLPQSFRDELGRFKKGIKPYNTGKYIRNSPATEFKKGNRPGNYRQIGSERITKDGYIEIKIDDPNKWKLKHRWIWESVNGVIPKGYILVCKTNNKLNCSSENWEMITMAENVRRNHNTEKTSEKMAELWKSEKIRQRLGLERKTKLRVK